MGELTEERVTQYLKANPSILEIFVTGPNVSKETFQKWINKRNTKNDARKDSKKRLTGEWELADLSSRRRIILDQGDQQVHMLYELAKCCGQVINTDMFDLYILNTDGVFLVYKEEEDKLKLKKVKRATKKNPVYLQKITDLNETDRGEIHFKTPVSERDKQLINIICTWAMGTVHYGNVPSSLSTADSNSENNELFMRQRKLNAFLLDVAKSIFQDIVSMDTVVLKVMNFAAKLVNADRASLFLVDQKAKQIYARIIDVGAGPQEYVKISEDGLKEIRFPLGKGISGYVASTGIWVNVENAYEHPHFNPEIDTKTGYVTKSMLCMPICIRGSVIGVMQMVNKLDGSFTKADEESFEVFAVYCGLALHHAKLYDRIRRSEQKYRVALEVLAYHSVCNRDEVSKLKRGELSDRVPELETFDFNGMRLSELEKPLYAVYMFKALFNDTFRYDSDDLIRFVLTVRKNYRRVAYHNWAHGWSVAHAMFVLLFSKKDVFTSHEALALYVSCLCHDLDHRGKNNAYMKTMSTPLASIYTTSVMEHHHFNQTVTILQQVGWNFKLKFVLLALSSSDGTFSQLPVISLVVKGASSYLPVSEQVLLQDGHNILRSMTSEQYKQALGLIKHCILATDLALFFTNKTELNRIIDSGEYDIKIEQHRKLTQAILMTGCDLIASAKPWQIQTETVKVIFEEFYEQGDAERLNGREPIAMMDRNKAHELPQMQVGFMRGICMPCYDLIARIIPEASHLRDRCAYNASKWEELAEEQKKLNEEREKASN